MQFNVFNMREYFHYEYWIWGIEGYCDTQKKYFNAYSEILFLYEKWILCTQKSAFEYIKKNPLKHFMLGVGLCIDCHSICYQIFISFLYKSELYEYTFFYLNLFLDEWSEWIIFWGDEWNWIWQMMIIQFFMHTWEFGIVELRGGVGVELGWVSCDPPWKLKYILWPKLSKINSHERVTDLDHALSCVTDFSGRAQDLDLLNFIIRVSQTLSSFRDWVSDLDHDCT